MKRTAVILGIIGGICGLPYIYGFFVGLNRALELTLAQWDYVMMTLMGLLYFAIPISSLLGGVTAMRNPSLGSLLMAASVVCIFASFVLHHAIFALPQKEHELLGAAFLAIPATVGAIFAFFAAHGSATREI